MPKPINDGLTNGRTTVIRLDLHQGVILGGLADFIR